MPLRSRGLLLAGVVALGACEGGGDPVQQAVREASAAHQAAAVPDGAVAATGRPAATPGDQALMDRMIEQHRAGMTMADSALALASDPEIRRMAKAIRDRQAREIAEMQAWTPATD